MKYSIQKIISVVVILICLLMVSCSTKRHIMLKQTVLFEEVSDNIDLARNKYRNKKIIFTGVIDDIVYPIDNPNECTIIFGGKDYIYETSGDCIFCRINERLDKSYEKKEFTINCKFDNVVKTTNGYYLIGLENGRLTKY